MKKKIMLGAFAFLGIFIMFGNTLGFSAQEQEQVKDFAVLKSLDYGKTDQALDIFIEMEGVYIYQVFALGDPLRLAIDISPVNQILSDHQYQVNEWSLVGIRVGQFHPYIVRVVFDFSDAILPYEVTKVENGLKISLSPAATGVIAPPPPLPSPVKEQAQISVAPVEPAAPRPAGPDRLNTMIGLSVGSYKISDELFQEVYPGSAAIYGLQLSRMVFSSGDLDVGISVEAKRTSKTGASTVTAEEAKFSITPLSIGAAVFWNTKYVTLFAGAGMDFYFYKEVSPLFPDPGYVKDSASGSHFQGGAYIRIPKLDALKAKIYYKGTKVLAVNDKIEANLGGSEFGLCLGYGFNLFKRR